MQWEYSFYTANYIEDAMQLLPKLGKDGWELTCFVNGALILKRPKPISAEVIPDSPCEGEYITPTGEHIGKIVEASDSGNEWNYSGELLAVLPADVGFRFIVRRSDNRSYWKCWSQARIKVEK